jgi:hypothetical protein
LYRVLELAQFGEALALERDGPQCRIVLDDFMTAMEAARRAKEAIGNGRHSPPDSGMISP